MLERAIVLQILRDDHAAGWSEAELASEIDDAEPATIQTAPRMRARTTSIWYPRLVPAALHASLAVLLKTKDPAISRAFVRADEGTRTLDLLHGKQTL
jgi:hypothetical protein